MRFFYSKLFEKSSNSEFFLSDCLLIFSVCSKPTHVDARDKLTNYTWTGTDALLIFDDTPKFGDNASETRSWSWGISPKFG